MENKQLLISRRIILHEEFRRKMLAEGIEPISKYDHFFGIDDQKYTN